MYVPIEVILIFLLIFALLIRSAWTRWSQTNAEVTRKWNEEHSKAMDARAVDGVRRMFWDISDLLELETSYEARDEYFDDGGGTRIQIWMKTKDVLEAAEINVSNARVLINQIDVFLGEVGDHYRLKKDSWADAQQLFNGYIEKLSAIAETHKMAAAGKIESYLDDPMLLFMPASQAYVERIGNDMWQGFEDHAATLTSWVQERGVQKIHSRRSSPSSNL